MTRKYFFFDIDGTLVNWNEDGPIGVPESTQEALRLLRENGHFTALATGRSYAMAERYLSELGFDNMVCDGGNGIVLDGKLIDIEPLDKDLACALVDECNEKGFIWGIQPDISCTRYVPDERFDEATQDVYMRNKIVPGLDPRDYEKIYKVYVVCDYPKELELETLKKLPYCRFGLKYIFVEPAEKSRGIKKIMETLGADPKDVVVFGDHYNDMSMFLPEWTSIAMGNAVDELKARASFVTTAVGDDGIYNACRHFGWI